MLLKTRQALRYFYEHPIIPHPSNKFVNSEKKLEDNTSAYTGFPENLHMGATPPSASGDPSPYTTAISVSSIAKDTSPLTVHKVVSLATHIYNTMLNPYSLSSSQTSSKPSVLTSDSLKEYSSLLPQTLPVPSAPTSTNALHSLCVSLFEDCIPFTPLVPTAQSYPPFDRFPLQFVAFEVCFFSFFFEALLIPFPISSSSAS
jgi:hypothetical protein